MLECYLSKWFGILELNSNHSKKIPYLVKQRNIAEETKDSHYVMTFNTMKFNLDAEEYEKQIDANVYKP